MEIIPLDKRNDQDIKMSISKMAKVTYQSIDYYIFAMKIKEIEEKNIQINDKTVTILASKFSYIEILPINKNYTLKIYYNDKDEMILLKCDITLNNFLDERSMPFYEETPLSIVLDEKYNMYEFGKEKLDEVLNKKEITEEEYNSILREFLLAKLSIKENMNMLKKVVFKYFNALIKKKKSPKKEEQTTNSNTYKTNIKPGIKVAIVLKKDQKTGILTEGIVKDILTNSAIHHRGIKVRLTDGSVGRVQKIL